ncbi:MAG: hypothetical protein AB1629_02815 [Candidatus Omnitrophota bacterium]
MKTIENSLIIIIICFISLVYLLCLDTQLGSFGGDNAQYIILAKALSSGQGYRAINFPHQPPYTLVPPVFALMLSPIVYFFGYNFFLMHILILVLAAFSLVFLFLLLKNKVNLATANLIVFLTGGHFLLLTLALTQILTEIPYIFFSLVAFFSFEQFIKLKEKKFFYIFVCIIATVAASLTRTIGIIIPLSFITLGLIKLKKEERAKAVICLGLLLLIPGLIWFARNILVASPFEPEGIFQQFFMLDLYDDDAGNIGLTNLFNRIFFNAKDCADWAFNYVFPAFIFSKVPLPFFAILRGLFILILCLGLWQHLHKKLSSLEIYFSLYIFFLLFWHIFEIARYLLPVQFLLFLYFFEGLKYLGNLNLKPKAKGILTTLVYLIILLSLFLNSIHTYRTIKDYCSAPTDHRLINFLIANKWVKANTEKDAVILSRKPTITSLFSERQSLGYPFTKDDKRIIDYIKAHAIKYIILDEYFRESARFLAVAIKKNLPLFKLRYRVSDTLVFEFKPD